MRENILINNSIKTYEKFNIRNTKYCNYIFHFSQSESVISKYTLKHNNPILKLNVMASLLLLNIFKRLCSIFKSKNETFLQ